MYMRICKIQMRFGKTYTRELKNIEYFWIRNGHDFYAISKRVLYELLVGHPDCYVELDLPNHPRVVPARSAGGEIYIRSKPHIYQHDYLFDLPLVK